MLWPRRGGQIQRTQEARAQLGEDCPVRPPGRRGEAQGEASLGQPKSQGASPPLKTEPSTPAPRLLLDLSRPPEMPQPEAWGVG